MKSWLKPLRRIMGTILFMMGMVALLIPVIPGWFLIACGLYILAMDSPGMQARIQKYRGHFVWFDTLLRPIDRLLGHEPNKDT